MGLAERLSTEPVPTPIKCSVGRLLDRLTPADASAFQDAINKIRGVDPNVRKAKRQGYTVNWLCAELVAEGYDIHRTTMGRHVNKECSCGS